MVMMMEAVMVIKRVMAAEMMTIEGLQMMMKVEAVMRVEVMMKAMTVPSVKTEVMMMKGAEITWCQHFRRKTVELTNKV